MTGNRIDKALNELEIGMRFSSAGRTVTESDVVNFCMFTGNWLEIHANAHYSASTRFGQRVVQGSLVFSLIPGLIQFGASTQANYGVDQLRFVHPVFIGDTVYVTAELVRKREKDDRNGIGTFLMSVFNQNGVLCQKSEFSLLMFRRPEDVPLPAAAPATQALAE